MISRGLMLALATGLFAADVRSPDPSLARSRVVLVCYCTDPTRCHRSLLAGILGKLGADVRGELR